MKIIIIEDEILAASRLEKMILELRESASVIAKIDSIKSTVEQMPELACDLIFMDIHLADGLCFEIFEQISIELPVVFTTAFDDYAIKAFDVNAIDYILKPIKKVDLERALKKFDNRSIKSLNPEIIKQGFKKTDELRFMVKIGQQLKVIEGKSIAYFYTEDKITFLIDKEGRRYPIDFTLDKLDAMLDPKEYYRINRQFIVHLNAIMNMSVYSKSRVKLELDPASHLETIVSTERSGKFKKWLGGEY